MQSRFVLPCLAVAIICVAGCGSSKKSSSTASTSVTTSTAPATTATSVPAPAKTVPGKTKTHKKKHKKTVALASRTYRVKLTGKAESPPGAPGGTGTAVISFRGKTRQVCWQFMGLKGFTHPTFAHIHKGKAGTSGPVVIPLTTGTTFLSKGCVKSTAPLLRRIESNPRGYYVNVHSTKFPLGAIRAQL